MIIHPYARIFTYVCGTAVFLFVLTLLRSSSEPLYFEEQPVKELQRYQPDIDKNNTVKKNPPSWYQELYLSDDMKYILQWTSRNTSPLDLLGKGRDAFLKNKCNFTNCYVTDDKKYFLSIKDFDAIVFHGRDLTPSTQFPTKRGRNQKYVYAMLESSHNYPLCNSRWNGFFNWTWTYKLDSELRWGYFTVFDKSGNIVAPAENPAWLEQMDPIDEELQKKLESKTKAAAWFVSNCNSKSSREKLASKLQVELKQYGLELDIYGACGNFKCARSKSQKCNQKLKNDYYFYLAFENSFSKDYVTEKVVTALHNLAVPIVYGAADYNRFLPPGSYLDAGALGVKELAKVMYTVIKEPSHSAYHDFFKWRNHYRFELTFSNRDICNMCALMNDNKFKVTSVYADFTKWWNREDHKCPT